MQVVHHEEGVVVRQSKGRSPRSRSNRSKADQGPAQWLPPTADTHCRYAAEWVGTKLRRDLAADEGELVALRQLADTCPSQTVEYERAP
ncbi:hypothetical protein GCM10010104_23730 [Streptomyces indiaensis]|uniref:Uncharacterized protein n=1 Tax=Streptomyces indiaensis TaxID=284033 RepID=A0ABN3DFM0_9ACTN